MKTLQEGRPLMHPGVLIPLVGLYLQRLGRSLGREDAVAAAAIF
jgi:hypothetical protein